MQYYQTNTVAIAAESQIGLGNWPAVGNIRRLPVGRRELAWLADTPLSVEQESWRGRRVVDCRGRRIGKVRDVLVETRTLDETAEEDGPRAWGVRVTYVAVRSASLWRRWVRPREVLLPVGKVRVCDGLLQADVDVTTLWPRLFGRTVC